MKSHCFGAAALAVLVFCTTCVCTISARGAVLLDSTLSGVSSSTGSMLSAHVVFSSKNADLTVTVTNTGDPANAPADVLTGVFFNVSGNPTLVPASIDFTTSNGKNADSLLHPAGNDVLGANWQFRNLTTQIFGDAYGIGASGLGGVFGTGNFASPGKMLAGVDYGIVNDLGSHANTGVATVPLVKHSLRFTLSGIGNTATISDVRVQYGSNLSEPTLGLVPEPTAAALFAFVLSAAALRRRSRTTADCVTASRPWA